MHCPPLLLGSTILHHYSYGMQNLQIQCSDIHSFKLLVTKYYVLSLCKFPSFSRDLLKGHVGIDMEFLEIINSLYQGDKMSEVMIKN